MGCLGKSLTRTFFLLFMFLVILPSASTKNSEPIWKYDIVDQKVAGYGNGYCPIVLGSNNNPYIAYTGFTPPNAYNTAKFSGLSGSSWIIQDISMGSTVDLKLDSKGNAHLLFETGIHGGLKYAKLTGTTWNIQEVTNNPVVYASMALDSYDKPHIAYLQGDILKYATIKDNKWQIQPIDSFSEISFKYSLALDSNNTPYILYSPSEYADTKQSVAVSALNLKLAKFENSYWNIKNLTFPFPIGILGNLAIDSDNKPHCILTHRFYSTEKQAVLENILYTSWDDRNFNTTTIASNVSSSNNFRLGYMTLDRHDYPHFVYITSSGEIMYGNALSGKWNLHNVVTNVTAYGPCYLAIDSNINPHISYRGLGTGQYQFGRTATMVYATTNQTALTPTSPDTDKNDNSSAIYVVIFLVIAITIVALSVLLYRRHRKPISQNKPNI
jgi:hypothetical protein